MKGGEGEAPLREAKVLGYWSVKTTEELGVFGQKCPGCPKIGSHWSNGINIGLLV